MGGRTTPSDPRAFRPSPALVRALLLTLAALASGCVADRRSLREVLDDTDLQARVAARAGSLVGRAGRPFAAGGQTFNDDCSGFVEAVYQAEGIPLRRLLQAAAPRSTSAVAAAWVAVEAFGTRWRGGEWPAPGDLVFFDDTWDQNSNGRRDDPLTHLGVVEWVEVDGTVNFVHRAGRGVTRGRLSLAHPDEATDAAGRTFNSWLRVKASRDDPSPALAGQLFAGFGRIDPRRAPR